MKIAMPTTRENTIDSHFGHCEFFTIFTLDDVKNEIQNKEVLPSPSGCGCKSGVAGILKDQGVKLLIAGNMGQGAVDVLLAAGIDVLRGYNGDVETVLSQWTSGTLVDSGELCESHDCHN